MKANNKGFTLIELIISVSISIILLGTVASLLWQSSNYYRRSNEEVALQMEAQTILNQLKELIGEADNVEYDSSSDPSLLSIQQGENLLYEISFDNSLRTLTFVKVIKEVDGSISRTDSQLFGKYVEDLLINSDLDVGLVKISFTLRGDFSSYEVKESVINFRNKIKPMESYW